MRVFQDLGPGRLFMGNSWENDGYKYFFTPFTNRIHVIYGNIGGILMVNLTIYSIHGSYGLKNVYNPIEIYRNN